MITDRRGQREAPRNRPQGGEMNGNANGEVLSWEQSQEFNRHPPRVLRFPIPFDASVGVMNGN